MDELKNLVIQSLETNGVLGQVRAQLRSCVFKVIDNQDQVEQRRSSFHWENQKARSMREDQKATLMAELIREFMEFYSMDYSLAIFKPEANLEGDLERDVLAEKAGLDKNAAQQPLLLSLLEGYLAGEKGVSSGLQGSPAPKGPDFKSKVQLVEPPQALGALPTEQREAPAVTKSTNQNLARANNLLKELDIEEKDGFNLGSDAKNSAKQSQEEEDEGAEGNSFNEFIESKAKQAKQEAEAKKNDLFGNNEKSEASNNYDDDFDDDIEEDLPEAVDANEDADPNEKSANTNGAGQGITISQSLGVDPSVDSLVLDAYDHIEPVERVA